MRIYYITNHEIFSHIYGNFQVKSYENTQNIWNLSIHVVLTKTTWFLNYVVLVNTTCFANHICFSQFFTEKHHDFFPKHEVLTNTTCFAKHVVLVNITCLMKNHLLQCTNPVMRKWQHRILLTKSWMLENFPSHEAKPSDLERLFWHSWHRNTHTSTSSSLDWLNVW